MFVSDQSYLNWKAEIVSKIQHIAIHHAEHEEPFFLRCDEEPDHNHVEPFDTAAMDSMMVNQSLFLTTHFFKISTKMLKVRLYHEVGTFDATYAGSDSAGNVCVLCFEVSV